MTILLIGLCVILEACILAFVALLLAVILATPTDDEEDEWP